MTDEAIGGHPGTRADDDAVNAGVIAGPTFDVPEHYGDPAALDALSSVAAPLLAGGTLALLGVVVQQPSSLRWPGLALLLLVVAAVMLVTAVQCGFWAGATPPVPTRWSRGGPRCPTRNDGGASAKSSGPSKPSTESGPVGAGRSTAPGLPRYGWAWPWPLCPPAG